MLNIETDWTGIKEIIDGGDCYYLHNLYEKKNELTLVATYSESVTFIAYLVKDSDEYNSYMDNYSVRSGSLNFKRHSFDFSELSAGSNILDFQLLNDLELPVISYLFSGVLKVSNPSNGDSFKFSSVVKSGGVVVAEPRIYVKESLVSNENTIQIKPPQLDSLSQRTRVRLEEDGLDIYLRIEYVSTGTPPDFASLTMEYEY